MIDDKMYTLCVYDSANENNWKYDMEKDVAREVSTWWKSVYTSDDIDVVMKKYYEALQKKTGDAYVVRKKQKDSKIIVYADYYDKDNVQDIRIRDLTNNEYDVSLDDTRIGFSMHPVSKSIVWGYVEINRNNVITVGNMMRIVHDAMLYGLDEKDVRYYESDDVIYVLTRTAFNEG